MRSLACEKNSRETMEKSLLSSPSDKRKKSRRWKSLKCFFQRRDEALNGGGDLKYFANLIEGSDDQDHTTVNLSHSGSNPYSLDESYDSVVVATDRSATRGTTTTTTTSSSTSSVDGDDGSRPRQHHHHSYTQRSHQENVHKNDAIQMPYSLSDSNFAQLDVNHNNNWTATMHLAPRFATNQQKHYPLGNTDIDFAAPNSSTAFVPPRSPKSGRGSNTSLPLDSSDLGMEVIMFDHQDDDKEGGIFLSFQTSKTTLNNKVDMGSRTGETPRNIPDVADIFASRQTLDVSSNRNNNMEYTIPESPVVSQMSESVTWVSHDDDDADERPMKEIVFPVLSNDDSLTDDLFLDNETSTEEEIVDETAPNDVQHRPGTTSTVRDAIFAQFEAEEMNEFVPSNRDKSRSKERRNALESQRFVVAKQPSRLTTYRSDKRRSARKSVSGSISSLSYDQNRSWVLSQDAADPHPIVVGIAGKTPTTAFLKRKSAFTGEDLLLREAESFAEFLEDDVAPQKPSVSAFKTSKVTLTSAFVPASPKSRNSTEHRLLIALTGSADSADDDIARSQQRHSPSRSRTYSEISTAMTGIDTSQHGIVTDLNVSTASASQASSTAVFSKSLSFEESFEVEEEVSTSYSSSNNLTPISVPGSLKYEERLGGSHAMCGGIFAEVTEDDFDDELTLRSEDFAPTKASRSPRRKREDTIPLLDQVRKDLLETVQDLAREGSSVMMQFLRSRQ